MTPWILLLLVWLAGMPPFFMLVQEYNRVSPAIDRIGWGGGAFIIAVWPVASLVFTVVSLFDDGPQEEA